MSTESTLWRYLKTGMTGKWLATRIESCAGNGVPDVAYTVKNKHGWMELKYIKEWPKRESTKIKLPLRPEQKLWIATRGKLADGVWVMCKIDNDYYLLDYELAILACDGWTRSEWDMLSNLNWENGINFDELLLELI